jgi:hypothetical protein
MKTKIMILTVLTIFLIGVVMDVGLARQRKEAVREGHTWGEEKPTGNNAALKSRVISENLVVRVNLVGLPVFVLTKVPQVNLTSYKIVNQEYKVSSAQKNNRKCFIKE